MNIKIRHCTCAQGSQEVMANAMAYATPYATANATADAMPYAAMAYGMAQGWYEVGTKLARNHFEITSKQSGVGTTSN